MKPDFDSNDYRLTLGVVERRAAEYLSFAIRPNLPEFLKYLKERKEKARNINRDADRSLPQRQSSR